MAVSSGTRFFASGVPPECSLSLREQLMDLAAEILVVTYETAVTVELAEQPINPLDAEAARTFERIRTELTSLLLRLGH